MPDRFVRYTLALLLLIGGGWPLVGAAQIHRCVTPDGSEVFTDRACEAVGAVEQRPQVPPGTAANRARPGGGCARNMQDLVAEMTGAFNAHDANRLAGIYHWTGMSGDSAYAVMARLDAIVQRPLVDIVPVMPAEPEPATEPAMGASDAGLPIRAEFDPVEPPPAPAVRRAPVALRVEQTLANGATPSHTVFGLQKHFGCWWIKG